MNLPYPRDLRGYGRDVPHARWPNGARIAVQFVLNYEEGGENNILHGDADDNVPVSEARTMRKVLEAHLERVEWKTSELPIRLYPFISAFSAGPVGEDDKPIAIDPRIAFGRPVVARKSISTQAITERIDAGESVEDVARDYDLEAKEVEEAVVYERAA